MRSLFVAILVAGSVSVLGAANAADGCGPGCRSAPSGACVVDGWGSPRVRNECPAGATPRPPCGSGHIWDSRLRACFALN